MTTSNREEFRIEGNASAFHILRDNIYSDKILAAIREICSNAHDAHSSKGIGNVPFEVTLPTNEDLWFRVRDFGPSMSHDFVMGLYSTFFVSTKANKADQVGEKGLGSKAAWAYAPSFSVRAFLDGRERLYAATTESEVPVIALLSDEPTDEIDGIEIGFKVKPFDRMTFARKFDLVMSFFDVMPVNPRTGEPHVRMDMPLILEGEYWRIQDTTAFGNNYDLPGVYIRWVCVGYKLPTSITNTSLFSNYQAIRLVIDVPAGSVASTASRESLSFDEHTESVVTKLIELTKQDIEQVATEKIQEERTYIDACKSYLKLRRFFPKRGGPPNYEGVPVTVYPENPLRSDVQLHNPLNRETKKNLDVAALGDLVIAKNDKGQKVPRKMGRIKYLAKDKAVGTSRVKDFRVFVATYEDEAKFDEFVKFYGFRLDQIIDPSTLPDPDAPDPVAVGERVRSGVYNLMLEQLSASNIDWENDDYYWVRIDKGVRSGWATIPELFADPVANKHLKSLSNHARGLGLSGELYALTPRMQRYAREDRQLGPVIYRKTIALKSEYILNQYVSELRRLVEPDILDVLNTEGKLSVQLKFHHVLDPLGILRELFKEEIQEARKSAQKDGEAIRDRYPMLYNTDSAAKLRYIKMVDERRVSVQRINPPA